MVRIYRAIMDSDRNPLRHLPPQQRFQIMVYLSLMWTAIFCASAGVWFLAGELIVAHLLLLSGVFITAFTFRSARKRSPATSSEF